jgi:hypothetical protein
MYFDGSYSLKRVGADVVLIPPEGDMLKYAIQIEFPITKTIAEYEGLSIQRLLIQGDSQVVAKQIQK